MKQLALISALLLAAAPAAAQLATSSRVQQLGGEPVQSTPTVVPTIGVFCIEEMTATFCNVVTGPNVPGHGFKLQAAIAGEYIAQMVARLECGVLAVPVHSARPDINYRAQGALPPARPEAAPKHVTAAMMAIAAVSRANLDLIIATISLRSFISARRIVLLSSLAQ